MIERVDATRETRVDWDREVESGNLVPASGQPGRSAIEKDGCHIQGLPLTPAEIEKRTIPISSLKHMLDTAGSSGAGRLPGPTTRHSLGAPPNGWPRFSASGAIVHDDDEEK